MYNVGSSPAVKYCTFTSNYSSLEGGGMYNEDCISDITNCIFTSNYSDQKGGGISNRSASPVMTNSTIRFNYATFGGAMYNNVLSFPKIRNSIIWENISNIYLNNMKNEVGSVAEFSYCLIEGSRGSVNWNSLIGADGGNNIDADPLFTSEMDFSLRVGSPAVDAGSNSLYKGNINTDQDLGGRVRLKGGAVDMGVYESLPIIPLADAAGIIYVNQKGAGDFSGNSWANATPALAEALKFAYQNNRVAANPKVKQIWVAKGIYWPMYSPDYFIKDGKNNAFRLVDNVKVYGGFDPDNGKDNLATRSPKDAITTLSGDFNENDAVDGIGNILDINSYDENAYHVVLSAGEVNEAELNGFTITGGDARGYSDINISTQYQLTIYQKNGGGMYIARSSPRLDYITFKSNNASSMGSGLYIENSFPTITNCFFGSNMGKYGGAMSNEKSSPTIINSYFTSNKGSLCSGIYNDRSSPDIINSTFSLNEVQSPSGSVIYNQNSSSPKIYNSIIYGNDNRNVSVVSNDGTSKPKYAYSIIQNSGGSANWRISGDNMGGNIDADPKFVSTTDFSLQEGSRAINTGNNDLFTDLNATTKDRAGNLRLQKGTIDMGAFESPYGMASVPDAKGILYVKKDGAGNFTGNNWDNAIGELADALIFAKRENEYFGSTRVRQIWVAGGVYKPMYSPEDGVNFGTDQRRDNAFLLVKDVEVYGGFAGGETVLTQRDLTMTGNRTTLSGDFNDDDVVSGGGATLKIMNNSENNFNVVISVGDIGYSGRLDGFTISGGNADDPSIIKVNSLDIVKSKGGGMLNFKSSPTIRNSVFSSNTAVYGGGMSNVSSSNSNITNTRFIGNYSTHSGGGLYIDASNPYIINSAFSSNYAAQEGGGVYIIASRPWMRNSSLAFNVAGVQGAGIMSTSGSVFNLLNSIVFDNHKGLGIVDNVYSSEPANSLVYNSLIGGAGEGNNWNTAIGTDKGYNIDTNPKFVSETDLSLQAGSPAINAGNNNLYVSTINIDKDLAGNPRLKSGTIDMGAYERQTEQQTIAPISNITKVYGNSSFDPGASSTSGLPISYSSSDSSIAEVYQDSADGDKWKIKIITVGTVNITANQVGDNDFDPAEPVDFTFTITKKPVYISLTSAPIEKVYDGTTDVSISSSNFSFADGNIVDTDDLDISLTGISVRYIDKNVGHGKPIIIPLAGLELSGTSAVNYEIANTADLMGTGDITAKKLTVVNDDHAKVYGEILDAADFTGSISGVVAGDVIILTRSSTGSLGSAVVGTSYPIVATLDDSNGKLTNYNLVNLDGVLTVTPKNIEIVAKDQVKTYGDSFAFTGKEFTQPQGLINGDAVSQVSLSSTGAGPATPVGSYDVVPADATGTGLENYNIKYTNGELVIGQRTLTVVNNNRSKVYGAVMVDADFTGSISGVVTGDGITLTRNSAGSLAIAIVGSNYPIAATLADPNNKLSNYIVVSPDGVLTVTSKDIEIVANNQVKTYGDSFAFVGTEFTTHGLINGDEVSQVSISSTGAAASAGVANYDIIPVDATGTGLENYKIRYTNGQLVTGQRILTVVNDDRTKVYGTVLDVADFTGSISGVVVGDGITLTRSSAGSLATAVVGTSPIAATLADPKGKLNNYNVVNADGVLTVTPKNIEIVAKDQVKTYGDSFAFTGKEFTQPQGLINGDAVSQVSLSSSGTVANATINSYIIVPGDAIGTGLSNYMIKYTNGQLQVGQRTLTVVNGDRSKVYGEVLNGDDFTGNISGVVSGDGITLTRNSSGSLATAMVGTSYPIVATLTDPKNKLDNYSVVNPDGVLTVTPKELIITAVDKERFAGLANPELTAGYDGFVNGEKSTVLTAQPVLHTSADLSSVPGNYDITVSAAAATNYNIRHVDGVMKVMANEPTDIILAAKVLYENAPEGTHAGTLSSTSPDLSAIFTYSLVSGKGDINNDLFAISGDKINTTSPLDFETNENCKIRVRVTNQYGKWLEKELIITVSDVNEVPTIAAISNQSICYIRSLQNVPLLGISAGPEIGQKISLTVISTNPALFDRLSVSGNGSTGKVSYQIKAGAIGVAQVTVTVKDDGGTANGGVDTYSQTFEITVNALPVLSITSNKGTQVSLGETIELSATGAATFVWAADNSILTGGNSSTLTVRPKQTTTYTVTGTNANGCSETRSFTITVLNDLAKIKTTNILSPNGDGYNDLWIVDNIDMYPNNKVKVFDKTGRIVYSKKDYDNSWDGTFNGTALAEGTYYYLLDFGNGRRNFKGFITIIREH